MCELAQSARESGCTRFQIKVGGDQQEDAARIGMLLESLPADELMLADANAPGLANKQWQ